LILSIPSHRDGARTTKTSRAIVVKKNYRLQDIQLSANACRCIFDASASLGER